MKTKTSDLRTYWDMLKERKVEIDEEICNYEKKGKKVPAILLEELWSIVGQLENDDSLDDVPSSGYWRSVNEKPLDGSIILFQMVQEYLLPTQETELTFKGVYCDDGLIEGYIHVNDDYPGDVEFNATKVLRWIPMHEVLELIV